MKIIRIYRRTTILFTLITACIFFLAECVSKSSQEPQAPEAASPPVMEFAGSQSCAGCHKDIYEKHLKTAHYLTSRPAAARYIKGSFEPGRNSYSFNDFVRVAMEQRDSNFYQVLYVNGIQQTKHSFDIVVGSGARGQSYLYWKGKELFQLPIFYFTGDNEWCNSPGYPGKVIFNRPITSRCLECHSTYIHKISAPDTPVESYDSSSLVYGVDCEKCHGSAVQHVAYQRQHPEDSTGKYIINPAHLSRQRNLELCTLCHGGRLNKTKPSFSFQPGDTLSNYFFMNSSAPDAASIDVHGNQYGLLSASRCFRSSDMTCMTCHNPHENQRGQKAYFSQRCLTCHSPDHGKQCPLTSRLGSSIRQNCIDCHMPEEPSKAIVFLEQRQSVPKVASMRSHYIKVYPDETAKFLQDLQKKKSR